MISVMKTKQRHQIVTIRIETEFKVKIKAKTI
jgi:hypothetical protein